jgi:uncharacterized protein (DUF1015 family)
LQKKEKQILLNPHTDSTGMATIHAFRPLHPNPFYADQLVFTKPQAESVSGDYTKEGALKPLKTLLETGARQRPETIEGQMIAYQDIRETLGRLLEKQKLWLDKWPGIFIYEVVHSTYRQTGIWALTSLQDYREGRIKIHELTFSESVRRLKNYREHTGLEGSPVLLTYHPDAVINQMIAGIKADKPKITLGNTNGIHKLWKIDDEKVQLRLIKAFSQMRSVYLADGHHRMESAAQLAKEQKEKGLPVFNTISTLYMSTDELRIEQYNRVVIPDVPINKEEFFKLLNQKFHIRESTGNYPIQPNELHRMGVYIDGQWYHLLAKSHILQNKDGSSGLDAEILQEHVLSAMFGITNPKTDRRLICAGGEKALDEIGAIVQGHSFAIAFSLCPIKMEQLIHAADSGQILPPKATWIVPKVPYGLLIHQH